MKNKERIKNDKIARLGCILCWHRGFEDTPAELHHVRTGNIPRKLAPVIPLCPEHHRGNTGIHAGKQSFVKRFGVDEQDLLKMVNQILQLQGIES